MSERRRRPQSFAPRSSTAVPAWALSIVRSCLLLMIALLPVQMRAGADEAHPHSILQLVLDAQDGDISHHGAASAAPHAHDALSVAHGECIANPDLPLLEDAGRLGGISMLSIPVLLMLIPAISSERSWHAPPMGHGRLPELEPPPPRARRA